VDALTGKELYKFAYAGSLLASITDPDGRVTTIHRENGKLASIESPFGQLTTFELYDSGTHKGYVKTIASPVGQVSLEYSGESYQEGLLTKLTDPKGYQYSFEYTDDGRFQTHSDPVEAGGVRTFERTFLPNDTGFKVDVTTKTQGLPLLTTYQIENLPGGAQKRTTILPEGLQATTEIEPDGKRVTTYPDGTTTTLVEKADERFGMQAPMVSWLEVATGGLTQTIERDRSHTPATGSTVESLTDIVRINGKPLTTTYSANPIPTITRTTPAGRASITYLDADGRVIKTSVKLAPNDPIQLYPTVYTYHQALPHKGRLQTVTHGTGQDARTYTFSYNDQGHVDSVQDPLGRTVSYQYYASGRVRTRTLLDGSIVELLYDANGNVTEIAPPRLPAEPVPASSDLHHFLYGPLDFLSTYTPPKVDDWLTLATTAQYAPNRLLDKVTKPVGMVIDPQYDSLARLQSIAGQQELSYSYYPVNAQEDHRGKLQAITSSPLSPDQITFGYTYQGNLLKGTSW
jgi:YD repeat-containing protein